MIPQEGGRELFIYCYLVLSWEFSGPQFVCLWLMFPSTLYSCSLARSLTQTRPGRYGWFGENKRRVRQGEARRVVSAHGALDDMGSSKRDYDGQFSVWHCLPRLRDEYHLGERGPEHWLQKPLKRPWFQPIASTAKNIRGLEEGVARENHSH